MEKTKQKIQKRNKASTPKKMEKIDILRHVAAGIFLLISFSANNMFDAIYLLLIVILIEVVRI